MEEQEVSKTLQMIAAANKETDRGCALILAANLDNRLSELLRNLYVEHPPKSEKNLFSSQGFPATFSSRIDMCYALGQIGEDEYHDMHLIRKIRNEFAHNESGLTFQSPSIYSRCTHFRLVEKFEVDYPLEKYRVSKPRNRFQILVATLCWIIEDRSKTVLEQRPIVRKSGSILPRPVDV